MSLSKIKLNTNTYDIIPHKVTDGTYSAQVADLDSNGYVISSYTPFNIPTAPTTQGEYMLTFTISSAGVVTPTWAYSKDAVLFTDGSATKFVFTTDDSSNLQLVYIYQ